MTISENRNMAYPVSEEDDPPPFLRTWNRLYVSIVVYTCVLILALYIMTITLNR